MSSHVVENQIEKSFHKFPELLPEIRKVLIDEMSPEDRCRLERCSNLCQKETRKSKKYIYGLKFNALSVQQMTLCVMYGEKQENRWNIGYCMQFYQILDEKFMTYSILSSGAVLSKVKLDNSTDLVQYAIEHFKKLLQTYHDMIKSLFITGEKIYDFEVGSLKNLEELETDDDIGIQRYITKVRKPLKALIWYKTNGNSGIENCEEIYQVRDWFEAEDLKLKYDQFLRISASKIRIHIGRFTEKDIYNFIKSWQNGEIRENFKYCCWNLSCRVFDIRELHRLFGAEYVRGQWGELNFAHNTEVGKWATLFYEWYDMNSGRLESLEITINENQQ